MPLFRKSKKKKEREAEREAEMEKLRIENAKYKGQLSANDKISSNEYGHPIAPVVINIDNQMGACKITSQDLAVADLKNKMLLDEFSSPYGELNGMKRRKIEMQVVHRDREKSLQRLSFGKPETHQRPEKVIMLVGATGAGKTTLINAMANYIFGVEFSDPFRLVLIDDDDAKKKNQAESQTDFITAYCFYYTKGMPFKFNYILVDTPGFGDTRGIQRDTQMMKQLQNFLEMHYGISIVDGIGFVTPASVARLTPTQEYIFDGLFGMFGRDVQKNIYLMTTWGDSEQPQVLETLESYEIGYSDWFKFQNSALFASNSQIDRNKYIQAKIYWEMGYESLNKFFIGLGKEQPVSLTLTKEVLVEKDQLETGLVGLQSYIKQGLGELSNLQQERNMLKQCGDNMRGYENYSEVIEVPNIIKHDLRPGEYVTNCLNCNFTCHFPCYIPNNNKSRCAAMRNGKCTVCHDKCSWESHKNMTFRYEHTVKKEKRIVQELLNRYKQAEVGKLTKEEAVRRLENDIKKNEAKVLNLVKVAEKHMQRLNEIALKYNPRTTQQYIELLIRDEGNNREPGHEKRMKVLENLRDQMKTVLYIQGSEISPNSVGIFEQFQNNRSEDS